MKDENPFIIFLIAFPISVVLIILKYGRDLNLTVIGISVAAAALLFIISYFCRRKFRKNNQKIPENESTKEYKGKSINYVVTHGFDKIKGKTMKDDLIRHFHESGTISFILLGFVLITVGLLPIDAPLWMSIGYAAVGVCVTVYGFYRLSGAQVKRFIKFLERNGENTEEISCDYMKGKLAYYKKSGICIGEKYTVCWNKASSIFAIKNKDIAYLQKNMQTVEHYAKSLFIGGDRIFQIRIVTKMPYYASKFLRPKEKSAVTAVTIDLRQYQDDMALEEYRKMNIEIR